MSGCQGCHPAPQTSQRASPKRPRTVAIVGPPNSGKSTLFNRLTGLRQKVANFQITVRNKGQDKQANNPGWLSRFLNWINPF